jgi:hypothetical protein
MNDFVEIFTLFKNIGKNYPEILEKIIVINENFIKDLNFKEIDKNFIKNDKKLSSKIEMLGSNFLPLL